MDQTSSSAISTNTLHCALELSRNSWLLAIQFPDREQPSLYPIEGGNTEKLMAKLTAALDCWAKVSGSPPAITLCYEVGYDAFWLARFLMGRGIECLVIDPGSLQVNRRGRPVKTDRVDVKMLLRTLIAWCRGERHVWSLVRIPSIDEEDLRRSHRERGRLVRERTAHINRIKGLLFGQGIRGINVKSKYKTLAVDDLVRRWSSLAAPARLRDCTADPKTCHGAGADCQDRARARHGADPLRGDRAQASSPAATEEHWTGDLSLAFA